LVPQRNFTEYVVSYDVITHKYTVADQTAHCDGTDPLHAVEYFLFAEGLLIAAEIVRVATLAPPVSRQCEFAHGQSRDEVDPLLRFAGEPGKVIGDIQKGVIGIH
jgi:hypothetical protein